MFSHKMNENIPIFMLPFECIYFFHLQDWHGFESATGLILIGFYLKYSLFKVL